MTHDRTKNVGHVEMSNGPSFNMRTPWTIDPTGDDYAIADAREEAWIRSQILKHGYPFTYEQIRSYISRNVMLSGGVADAAIAKVQNPDATMYDLFAVARAIHDAMDTQP